MSMQGWKGSKVHAATPLFSVSSSSSSDKVTPDDSREENASMVIVTILAFLQKVYQAQWSVPVMELFAQTMEIMSFGEYASIGELTPMSRASEYISKTSGA
ncbi:uncharacterized protein ARMOST_03786 [Armillaria ostoyae]|uniref:Uncharacterized protein n=1 Tax=Armillaria ostoyae TaxID=47428 RepID=A0A284QVL2_ARMOS|nr:uncharacterized protein ARMOST_03786 [Armillaria ostoyae]